VSFLPVLIAACIVELLPVTRLMCLGLMPAQQVDTRAARTIGPFGRGWRVVLCVMLFGATLGYGYWRRGKSEFQPGPSVALIQGNVTSEVKHDRNDWPKIQRQHEMLTGLAVKQQPDLIVWPETMFRWPLLETPLDVADEELEKAHPQFPFTWLRDLQVRHHRRSC
jgi:apolipoprotein N-acyltransferase